MVAFNIKYKDNVEKWGQYNLEDLKYAYNEISELDREGTTGRRVKDRTDELKDEIDKLKEDGEKIDQRKHDSKIRNQGIFIGFILSIIAGLIIAGLSKLFF